ncbi:error-prone DNA polymerase [Haloglycomyces albus]|uniref:error-prone DNA polymerase n=1 Tax=Haloglycomyces albus TaxID=526067 RepID=UPI00046D240A|nr:error-prone DNA polymerase [Haloglycomyces albus]
MTDYAELHAHSYFSFADGADSPADLVAEAERLGLTGLAITDHDGLYAVSQFATAARRSSVRTIFGSELNLDMPHGRRGNGDPAGTHLVVLARNATGYRRLSRAITDAKLAGSDKELPNYSLSRLAEHAGGDWHVLTGCRKGPLNQALASGPRHASRALHRLIDLFGRERVTVELTHHDRPGDSDRVEVLTRIARQAGVGVVATNGVHFSRPERARVAAALAATRMNRSLDEADPYLDSSAAAFLRSAEEMRARFVDVPGAVEHSVELAADCAFDFQVLAPRLPLFDTPREHDEFSYLAALTTEGACDLYGPPGAERVAGAWRQLEYELRVIRELGFSGYFLIVADIVRFCRAHNIYCQGRGSAANSAVCYALRITNVDAVGFGLLFERFLSAEREGPPDIDLDIESGRREEVIQYVYAKYGRRRAAQVANVITYRPRSAVQDAAKAYGHDPDQATRWSKRLHRWTGFDPAEMEGVPPDVADLAGEFQRLPRHLGVHPGGMVICESPVSEIVPIEWARAAGRSVLQWDKEDCADAGLVKFDLLGLGMLGALHTCIDLIAARHGHTVDLARLPPDDGEVYDLLCRADTVGVFQVESRAQMSTLPRLKPRCFQDLVAEIALIRPGPVQGQSVHPYLQRRAGKEWRHEVPEVLHPALEKTYGVPLYQEQLMQMAIDAAGFDASEADLLRRAMGSKRSSDKMEALRERLFDGMAERGIVGADAERVFQQLTSFADFGFPESHSASFAHLVYSSAWLKCHYPAAFYAALLANQPMGFYSPATLVADAQRHGITVHSADVNASNVSADIEPITGSDHVVFARADIRLGLDEVKGLSKASAQTIVAARREHPYRDVWDLARRTGIGSKQMEALAIAGAVDSLEGQRRQAMWKAGMARDDVGMIAGTQPSQPAPVLPGMSDIELAHADWDGLGLSTRAHPIAFVREELSDAGVVAIVELLDIPDAERVEVAGIVTHRQRPPTARGVTFVSLEDETGLINVICSEGLWERWRDVAVGASALRVRGQITRADDARRDVLSATNITADKLTRLTLATPEPKSRDFR